MFINEGEYRSKVLGCWLGKNIGGALGAPFEWVRQVNHVSFYSQDLAGDPLPNDDLDIQLLWLVALEEMGVEVDAHRLAEYWVLYVTPHWAEYGTAKVNMRSGLHPPLSGSYNNIYKDSCGAFIRSEIWACIAPAVPELAARFAYEDAILDHGDGEGVYGEVFCAAMESAAFAEQDVSSLIEIGLSHIPGDCGVAKAVHLACDCYRSGKGWLEARDLVLSQYRGGPHRGQISAEDLSKGFGTGQQGWDVPSNIGMLTIGLLYGEGDFDRSLCTTVNCGEDTDCTGATVGALFGLIHGVEAIPSRWVAPIGRRIKTACLNLGELGYYGNQLPADVDDLTRRTERIAREVILRYNLPLELGAKPTDLFGMEPQALRSGSHVSDLYRNLGCPVYRFGAFTIAVDYGDAPTIRAQTPKTIRLRILNTYKVQANLNLRWLLPDGWQVLPGRSGTLFSAPARLGGNWQEIEFQLLAGSVEAHTNRAVVELTSDGRPTAMLVPITLLNGNLAAPPPHS